MIRGVGATRIPAFSAAAMRAAREAKGWSQGRLAAELDLAVVTVSTWERGGQAPEPPTFVLLAAALDIDPGDLLDRPREQWTLTEMRVVHGLHQQTAAALAGGVRANKLSQVEAGYERLREPLRTTLAALYEATTESLDRAWENGRQQLINDT